MRHDAHCNASGNDGWLRHPAGHDLTCRDGCRCGLLRGAITEGVREGIHGSPCARGSGAGRFAQTIDGVLGMAYSVSATTFMLSLGVSPAVASASVHAAEMVTTGLSGLSHFGFGNVDRVLVRRLMIPGMLGCVTGAYLLVSLPGERIKPFIAGFLLIMGVVILAKARVAIFAFGNTHQSTSSPPTRQIPRARDDAL